MNEAYQQMQRFDEREVPSLLVCVRGALDFFQNHTPPRLPPFSYKRPLVVGSGNAAVLGQIIFGQSDAVFADESSVEAVLRRVSGIDGAVIFSASGSKHAVFLAELLTQRNIATQLITTSKNAPAARLLQSDSVHVFPKMREPYTYNTSTYLGPLLAHTQEGPAVVATYIEEHVLPNFVGRKLEQYDAFYFLVPARYMLVRDMILTKFDELFGSRVSARVFTPEQTKHAKLVVPNERELFIDFTGGSALLAPQKTIAVAPPEGYASALMASYAVVGLIQEAHPPYFTEYIQAYIQKSALEFGQSMNVIVEGEV
ncbi:MAG: hypothetical protein AAB421_02000 [Patescibacteria group bacterium]